MVFQLVVSHGRQLKEDLLGLQLIGQSITQHQVTMSTLSALYLDNHSKKIRMITFMDMVRLLRLMVFIMQLVFQLTKKQLVLSLIGKFFLMLVQLTTLTKTNTYSTLLGEMTDLLDLHLVTGLVISSLMVLLGTCLLYTSPSPRDTPQSRMPSSA